MDIIKLDFEQAKAKHLMFKSKLRSILYGAEIDEAPVLSHYECAVGKWIYSHAFQAYGHLPEMQELEKVHAEIHSSARKLVEEYKEGKVEKARTGLTDMEKVADHLVQLLGTVEEKIAANPPPDNSSKDYQAPDESRFELESLLKANLKLDQIIKEQSGEILRERETLHNFFMQTPAIMAITKGPDHVYELANDRYFETVGHRKIIGKKLREALPELEGQGFFELMDEVYKTGKPYIGKETPVKLQRNGVMEELFIDFSYVAFKNSDGETDGILVFAYDVTQQVNARHLLEEA
ncbi:MAG: arcB, partial [Bacteroidetes bacterium]|nr:arcB [Bacteroidota bacterium]